jgi:rare lipoprotein A
MREGGAAARFRAARRWALTGAVVPLFTGCAVVGFPGSPPAPSAGPAGIPTAAPSDGELIVRPAPAPASIVAAAAATPRAPRQYEVFGERYTLMESAENYVEVGVASWYGRELAGRRTASGEIFDPQGMTAAHRTLPMSTWVEVTNLDNGRSVVLRVNDRGPFSDTHERIIDVSYAAARALGIVVLGTARVEVKAVPPPLLR